MNEIEAKRIIASMMAIYPNYNVFDVDAAIKAWASVMDDCSYEDVSAALKAYARSDTTGFAPSPGNLIEIIHSMKMPQALNEKEAWALVRAAISRSGYYSEEEFAKLPTLAQKAVGAPSQLKAWALDENYNEGVISSQFIRCYRAENERAHSISKMPIQVQRMIESASNKLDKKKIANKEAGNIIEMDRTRAQAPDNMTDRVKELWRKNG